MWRDLQRINVVGTGVDDDITADVHLTEPTESNYIHSSHVSSTKLINFTQKQTSSVTEADIKHAKPLQCTVKVYMYLSEQP